jgi:hypothetical protein
MKTTPAERELLVAAATSAHRARDADGRPLAHPAWMDLDEAGRRAAFDETLALRELEAAADARGLSSTGRAVLGRILRRRS